MGNIVLMAVVIALAAFVADRLAFLKKRPLYLGVWFGFFAIMADTCVTNGAGLDIMVGLGDAASIVAAFFFNPLAGIVTGGIASVYRAAVPLWGSGMELWLECSVATLMVSLYGAAIGHWVFEDRRPLMVPAAVAAAFGVIFHLSLLYLLTLDNPSRVVEAFWVTLAPMSLGTGLTAALTAFLEGKWGGFRRNFLSTQTMAFVFFGVAFGCVVWFAFNRAEKKLKAVTDVAIRDLWYRTADRLSGMLYSIATSIIGQLPEKPDEGVMKTYAERHGVDIVALFDKQGGLVVSNSEEFAKTHPRIAENGVLEPFLDLVEGRKKQVAATSFSESSPAYGTSTNYFGMALPGGDGLILLAYEPQTLSRNMVPFFFPVLDNVPFSETGCFITADQYGCVALPVYGQPHARGKRLDDLGIDSRRPPSAKGRGYHARIFGTWCHCIRYENIPPWRFYSVTPLQECYGSIMPSVLLSGIVLFLFSLIFRMFMLRFILARRKLDAMREAEEKRRKEDMELAHTIQTSELREDAPDTERYRIAAFMKPAREVGGDFYDFYDLPDGKTVLTMADVSGKGIPAAIFMMKAKAALRVQPFDQIPIEKAVGQANVHLCQHNDALMFVTAWVGLWNPEDSTLQYVSAGHNPPMLRHADGSVEELVNTKSPALAVSPRAKYRAASVQMKAGDTLFLYTDGVTEAKDTADRLFGEARLKEALSQDGDSLLELVKTALDSYIGTAPQADDITMLTFTCK